MTIVYSFPNEKILEETISKNRNCNAPFYFETGGIKINLYYKAGVDILNPLTALYTYPDIRKPGLQNVYQFWGTMPVCAYNEYLTDTFFESNFFKADGFYDFFNQSLDLRQYTITIVQKSPDGGYIPFEYSSSLMTRKTPTDKVGFLLR